MTQLSLGERLKTINAQTEADRVAKATRDEAARNAKAAAELAKVQGFFDDGKRDIISAIELGKKPKGLRMPSNIGTLVESYRWTEKNGMAAAGHKYHCVWQEFLEWAHSNGLEANLEYGWDGGGMESWHTLVVKPM